VASISITKKELVQKWVEASKRVELLLRLDDVTWSIAVGRVVTDVCDICITRMRPCSSGFPSSHFHRAVHQVDVKSMTIVIYLAHIDDMSLGNELCEKCER
jgi:hypothetical protein